MRKLILHIAIISMVLLYYGCGEECPNLSGVKFHDGEAKYYLFGLTGGSPGSPSVEVFYSQADKDSVGKNNVVRRWLSPPCVFGEHDVYYTYEYVKSNTWCIRNRVVLYTDSPGASGYLKVINHSDEKVKMFISQSEYVRQYEKGEHYTRKYNGTNWNRGLSLNCSDKNLFNNPPLPCHKHAPVSYLLFPERAPNEVFNQGVEKGETTGSIRCKDWYLFSDTMGELKLTRPWTVEEVMNLYEAEYTKENSNTFLHFPFRSSVRTKQDPTKRYLSLDPIYDDNGDYTFDSYNTFGISSMYYIGNNIFVNRDPESDHFIAEALPLRWYVEIPPHDSFVAQANKIFFNTFKFTPDDPREERVTVVLTKPSPKE